MSFYFYIKLLYVFNYMYAYILLYVRIYIICIYICTCRVIIYIQYIHMYSTICMHIYSYMPVVISYIFIYARSYMYM